MKERLRVSVDKNVLSRFKNSVIAKHGTLWRALSEEVEEALRLWLERHAHTNCTQILPTQNSSEAVKRVGKTERVWSEVKAYLIQKLDTAYLHKVSRNLLVEAITHVRGGDRRTIHRWLREFIASGLIRWNGGNVFVIEG
ncbi:MAG: hypothetical protein ACTSWP_10785 [Candidatus Freyarchaeota archaeon]